MEFIFKNGKEMEFAVKHDKESDLISSLLKEYELVIQRWEGQETRLIQVISVMLGVLGTVFGYFANQQKLPPIWMFWLLLAFIGLSFVYIIIIFNAIAISQWNARVLSHRVNNLVGEKALISADRGSPGPTFLSSTRGSKKVALLYHFLVVAGILLSLFFVVDATSVLYSQSHFQASLFVSAFISLLVFLLVTGSSFLNDLPSVYKNFLSIYSGKKLLPNFECDLTFPAKDHLFECFAWIIPRPKDILAKMWFFIYGVASAWLFIGLSREPIAGLPYNRLQLINFLFSVSNKAWDIYTIPVWATCLLWILYFIVEEILLQQAKLLWNDIRDIERDKKLLHNRSRPVAMGIISINGAISNTEIRMALAFLLGYLLGGFALVLVFCLIIIHQAMYVLKLEPEGKDHPVRLLFWLSFNNPLKFLAGLIAVVGFHFNSPSFVFLFVLFYFYSFGGIAAQWKMEAEHQQATGQDIAIRPQSEHFLQNGNFWQHRGLLSALLISICIVFVIPTISKYKSVLQLLNIETIQSNSSLSSIAIEAVLIVILTILLIFAFMLIACAMIYIIHKIDRRGFLIISIRENKILLILIISLLILILSMSLMMILNNIYVFYLVIPLLASLVSAVMYEGMKYSKFAQPLSHDNQEKNSGNIRGQMYNVIFKR